jgi:phospholipid transport system substrate-binding protein
VHRLRPVLLILAVAFASLARAEPEPPVALVDKFHDALLSAMKQGGAIEGRYKTLEPAIDATFDLATMTKFTVGPTWSKMSTDEQTGLIKAFRRMTVASYARNFDAFKGQKFVTDPKVEVRGPDRLVKSQVIPAGEKPVNLTYRIRRRAEGHRCHL